jgi:hypothetical protein
VVSCDRVQHGVVGGGDGLGLRRLRDLLPEDVHGRELSLRVQAGHGATGVVEGRTRDVGSREALDDRTGDGRQESDDDPVHDDHGDASLRGVRNASP